MADEPIISRGFRGRRPPSDRERRIPPGQYEEQDFPVLSAGPTPRTPLSKWSFEMRGVGGAMARWTWEEFQGLPHGPALCTLWLRRNRARRPAFRGSGVTSMRARARRT